MVGRGVEVPEVETMEVWECEAVLVVLSVVFVCLFAPFAEKRGITVGAAKSETVFLNRDLGKKIYLGLGFMLRRFGLKENRGALLRRQF